MPIKIANDLPAARTLEEEGVPLIRESDAIRQDVRPLEIALLNLMPQKIKTETQFARLLGATPLQVELQLLFLSSHDPKNTPREHMASFYQTWEEVKDRKFDGLIVTGAPIEKLPFEDVDYWDELCEIFDWTQSNVHSSFDICWGAQAAMHHFHGVPKYELPQKMFGVYPHRVVSDGRPLLRGFNDVFNIPVSRYTEVHGKDIAQHPDLRILAEADDAGICLVEDEAHRHIYMFNHLEYDATTLKEEYERDISANLPIDVPKNYFPKDDPSQPPVNSWRSFAHLMVANWINEVYQTTPFDLANIGGLADDQMERRLAP